MTPKEYNAMPEGDTKLAARCAITCGWQSGDSNCRFIRSWCGDYVEVTQKIDGFISYNAFEPFTDPSIPYGLIGRGVASVIAHADGDYSAISGRYIPTHESKTHAIVNAFCAADPQGHWARFMKDAE
jgi:hypothetical protein